MAITSCITLTTDFGQSSEFVGIMKGVICGINPNVQLIDISHEIEQQNIVQAAFVLSTAYRFFPSKTVHVVVVDPGVGSTRKPILISTENYYFIGPDNGVFTRVVQSETIIEIIELNNNYYFLSPVSNTFHGRDIFAPVAGYLSKGIPTSRFGNRVNSIVKIELCTAKLYTKCIQGNVVHIDRFGNLITNVDSVMFAEFVSGKKFTIHIKDYNINKLNRFYSESKPGELLALVGSSNLLEISINQGNASKSLAVGIGEPINVIIEE